MKVSVDCACSDKLFELNDVQKKVIANDIPSEILDEDMKRRLHYILNHKYNRCFKRLKDEWEPKLAAAGVASIPTNPDAFAELVFSQPEYRDRSQREEEAKAKSRG